jgi:uncharacterized membrane protein (UPF0127 family)
VNARTGGALSTRLARADTFLARFRGLLGRGGLGEGEGLWIVPCGSIHTCFMRFPIDVLFLDREGRVTALSRSLPPWRAAGSKGGVSVLELPAGTIDRTGTVQGDRVEISGHGREEGGRTG